MKSAVTALVLAGAAVACSGKSESEKKPAPAKPVVDVPLHEQKTIALAPGIDTSGMHLDDDPGVRHTPAGLPATVPAAHAGRPIDITLRSTPPGAQVAVDGEVVGVTPTYASVMADGAAHDFTFTLPHYALARYRFVPVTSGVIHTKLEPVIEEPNNQSDDDAPDPEPTTGSSLVNPPPAPTVPRPDAAMMRAPAPVPVSGSGSGSGSGSTGFGPEP